MFRFLKKLIPFRRRAARPAVRHVELDTTLLDARMPMLQDYPRPDWDSIDTWIGNRVKPHDHADAYTQTAARWLGHIKSGLAAKYAVHESENFLLLTAQSPRKARRMLRLVEAADAFLLNMLGGNVDAPQKGKLPILYFASATDYDNYIAYYFPHDPPPPEITGLFIQDGYPHIVLHGRRGYELDALLVHKIAHAVTADLNMPRWLDEGVALVTEDLVYGAAPARIPAARKKQHVAFWSEQGLDAFWYGEMFTRDTAHQFAFELAELLMRDLMARRTARVSHFLLNAAQEDAGAAAAESCFHTTLGALASTFLGSGNWEPGRIRPR